MEDSTIEMESGIYEFYNDINCVRVYIANLRDSLGVLFIIFMCLN